MSNNHPNDNIYSILGKLDALKPTQEEKHQSLLKEIRESVEAKGSITEGVGSVETRLLKEFAETKSVPDLPIDKKGIEKHYGGSVVKMGQAAKAAGFSDSRIKQTGEKFLQGKLKETDVEEKAPPGAKAERMVKGIKKSLSKDGHLSGKDKAIAYATTWKAHNKGTVEEAPAVCAECGMTEGSCEHTMAEAEITRKPGVTTHRKTDFPGYPADDIDDIDDLRGPGTGKRGRPRKHAAKAPTGLGRGRPVKAKAPTFSKQADPFGRVSGAVPKGTKGTVHSMAESMTNLEKSLRRISEGVNFAELLKEKHQTVDEMIAQLTDDIKLFKETGHCSELLKDCMEIKGYHGKMVADEAIGGIGQDLVTPQQRVAQATPPKPGIMGAVKDVAQGASNWLQGKPETGATYEEADSMKAELDELAKLAGLQTSEGNAFTGKLASTPKGGSFELDGKTFKDTSTLDEEPNEGNAFSGAVAKAKADGVQPGEKITVGGKEYPVKEADVTVDEPSDDDIANDPEQKYGTIKQITTQGDDMNRQKRQDPHTANKAANPLTNDKLALEAKLAAEYESIKKVSK